MISVLITNYNHGQYLRQAIMGILDQSYRDVQLIVVDDGSTDNSRDVIEKIRPEIERLGDNKWKIVYVEKNGGNPEAIRLGVTFCTGEYIFVCAADDYLVDNNFFLHAVALMQNKEDIGLVYGSCVITDGEKACGTLGVLNKNIDDKAREFLNGTLFIPGASVIIRRSVFEKHGGLNFEYGPQCDFFLNHVIALSEGVMSLMRHVAIVRYNPNSYSHADPDRTQNHRKVEARIREMFPALGTNEQWAQWRKVYSVQ